jgi:hypothetical protein
MYERPYITDDKFMDRSKNLNIDLQFLKVRKTLRKKKILGKAEFRGKIQGY